MKPSPKVKTSRAAPAPRGGLVRAPKVTARVRGLDETQKSRTIPPHDRGHGGTRLSTCDVARGFGALCALSRGRFRFWGIVFGIVKELRGGLPQTVDRARVTNM